MSRMVWSVPSSPWPPCRRQEQHLRLPHRGEIGEAAEQEPVLQGLELDSEGGAWPTDGGEELGLVGLGNEPRAVSTTATWCPILRRAAMTCTGEASATSRSAEVPPVRTVIRM
jgi:hypothetical protein